MTDLEQKARTLVDNFETSCTGMEPEAHPLKDELAKRIAVAMQALVAAAYAACAEHHPQDELDKACKCSCGVVCESWAQWEEHIRSLTPADAARELERIKASVRRDELEYWPELCNGDVNAPERHKRLCKYHHRLEDLASEVAPPSEPAPERCPSQFLGAFCELPKGHLGNHRGDEGEWKDYFTERLSKPAPVERSNENG